MRIGILETDIVDKDIREQQGSYADMFQRLFLLVDANVEFQVYKVIDGEYPENIDECSAYIITGSKFSAYENIPWIERLCRYIVELNKYEIKLTGICFGHQIIAQALGGRVEKSKKGWGVGKSISDIQLVRPWMKVSPDNVAEGSILKQFSLLVIHQDQVIRLPDQAERIAGSSFCENASFQIKKHILTFQGHPEFSVDYLVYLMNKRCDDIGENTYSAAIESMKHSVDAQLIAQWILRFCRNVDV